MQGERKESGGVSQDGKPSMQKHVFVAAVACRFWHVTGLVVGMLASNDSGGREPCNAQDTDLSGSSQSQAKVCVVQ
jgi:hypothetical protein